LAPVGFPYPSTIIPTAAIPQQSISPQSSFIFEHALPIPVVGYTGAGFGVGPGGVISLKQVKSVPEYLNENSV